MITLKNLKAKRPGDKLLDHMINTEVYDSRTRDDHKLRKDYQEDYTIDDMDKGVPSLATKE